MPVLTWAGTIQLKKGERTRLACRPSRLGEDFNPLISSHRTVKTKRVIRVFSQPPNRDTPEACAPLFNGIVPLKSSAALQTLPTKRQTSGAGASALPKRQLYPP